MRAGVSVPEAAVDLADGAPRACQHRLPGHECTHVVAGAIARPRGCPAAASSDAVRSRLTLGAARPAALHDQDARPRSRRASAVGGVVPFVDGAHAGTRRSGRWRTGRRRFTLGAP